MSTHNKYYYGEFWGLNITTLSPSSPWRHLTGTKVLYSFLALEHPTDLTYDRARAICTCRWFTWNIKPHFLWIINRILSKISLLVVLRVDCFQIYCRDFPSSEVKIEVCYDRHDSGIFRLIAGKTTVFCICSLAVDIQINNFLFLPNMILHSFKQPHLGASKEYPQCLLFVQNKEKY